MRSRRQHGKAQSGCLGIFVVVALFVVLIGVWQRQYSDPSPSTSTSVDTTSHADKISAWVAAQRFVERRLKSPGTAKYGSVWGGTYQDPDDCVMHLGGAKYKACGWVDSQNAFGATMRTEFIVCMERTSNGWQLLEEPVFRQR